MQDRKKELLITLGSTIKDFRKDKSISRLSNEIELSKSIWSELEKGRKDIQLTTFWKIAEALEVSPSVLLGHIEELLGKDFSFIENVSCHAGFEK